MPELEIARAVPADVADVMQLVRACIADMRRRGIDQWDDLYPTEARFTADAESGALFVGAIGSERAIATFVLDDWQDSEYADIPWTVTGVPTAVVHRLMVHPRHQGRGIARALMRFAEQEAARLGFGAVRLDAFSLNPQALRLYPSLGYRDAGSITLRKGAFRCFERRLTAK